MAKRTKLARVVASLLAGVAGSICAGQAVAAVTADELKKELGLSAYVQGGYTYNFENPETLSNAGRWEPHSNSFTLDMAEIQFLKEAVRSGAGYKLKIIGGDFAKSINTFGIGVSQSGGATDAFDVLEAYAEYVAPLGNGLKFRAGRMGTFHGAEVIEARDNPTYSRSLLFLYAEPLTHTGVMANYAFSDALNAGIHVVNGWDNTSDNNRGKTVGFNLNYAPAEAFSTAFNFMYGPEQNSQAGRNRLLFTWVGTVKPIKPLSVVLALDYGREDKALDKDGDGDLEDTAWYGISATARFDVSDAWSVAARGEYFKDKDGARTGVGQTLKEVTVAAEIRLAGGFVLKPEYRHDWSDEKFFPDPEGAAEKKMQDTVALGAMYSW